MSQYGTCRTDKGSNSEDAEFQKGSVHTMKTPDQFPQVEATDMLRASFAARRSRRALLKIAAAGAAGVTALSAGGLLLPKSARAQDDEGAEDSIKTIFSIAVTAERLAVTFYSNGLAEADDLGLSGINKDDIEAALVEEQIHELFFEANGGVPLTSTFSFPHGEDTFDDLATFIATQQMLEGVFDSAFLAAIKEFAQLGRPDLAQIAGQIACIESEHRALGRQIGGLSPADNWAFAPVFFEAVGDAPAVVAAAGFLSPKPGNSFTYHQVSTADEGVTFRTPVHAGEDND